MEVLRFFFFHMITIFIRCAIRRCEVKSWSVDRIFRRKNLNERPKPWQNAMNSTDTQYRCALMRTSSHGRASKRGRKMLYNVCAEAILRVLVTANRDHAVYVGRAHASTTHDGGATRVHAICIHNISTCDYVSLSHDAFSASAAVFLTREIFTIQAAPFRTGTVSRGRTSSLQNCNPTLLKTHWRRWFLSIWSKLLHGRR